MNHSLLLSSLLKEFGGKSRLKNIALKRVIILSSQGEDVVCVVRAKTIIDVGCHKIYVQQTHC